MKKMKHLIAFKLDDLTMYRLRFMLEFLSSANRSSLIRRALHFYFEKHFVRNELPAIQEMRRRSDDQ